MATIVDRTMTYNSDSLQTEFQDQPKPQNNQKQLKWSEITPHNHKNDCWVVIHGKVYDLTEFLKEHPGGPAIILK